MDEERDVPSDGDSIVQIEASPNPTAPRKLPKPVLPKLKVPSKPISMNFVKKYIKTPLFDAKDSYGKMNKLL